ncbi:glycosyltransferase [Actinomadura oligospora]|uniref:glycosyltransferase n=1 Tax=Actinomadura oligospora TaxID=111804 RepID=UPI0006885207|nr:glycosyltransferase [Actinomadura oligospora]
MTDESASVVETGPQDRPLRVLHVSQPTTGGVAGYVAQTVAAQRRRGWEVFVACPRDGALPRDLRAEGVPHHLWEAGRAPGPGTLDEARMLRRIIAVVRPDVVHLHSSKAGLAGRLPGVATRRPVIFQPHGWSWLSGGGVLARASAWWERRAAHRTDAIVCVGEGERRQGTGKGIRDRLWTIRNGVDLSRFPPADQRERELARERLGLPQGVPLVVCLGRVTRQKGQDILLDAWDRVGQACPDAELVIVGSGDALDELRRRGPGDRVRFVPEAVVPRDWYAAANVVTLPSRWEGLPLVALEALAVGRSVVASRIPGLTEVVTSDVGALVTCGDADELARALALRLQDPGLAASEAEAAGVRVRDFDMAETQLRLCALTLAVAMGTADAPALSSPVPVS